MVLDAALVGRDEELAELQRLVVDASLPGVVVAGAGGVGKSRLARTALEAGRRHGLATATALATRSTATIPLGAFAHLIGDVEVRSTELLTRVRDRLVDHGGGSRLVVLIDDAHLLDDVSAAVLPLLADDPRIGVLVTVRSGEPAPDPVTALWKDLGAPRLDLGPLDDRDADRLAEQIAGAPLDEPSHVTLRRAAQGNPLAITELVTAALDSGRLDDEYGVLRLHDDLVTSHRIIDLIGGRLDDLDDAAMSTLALTALAEPVTLAMVERLGRRHDVSLLERRGLVQVGPWPSALGESATDGLVVRLGHPLFGELALDRVGVLGRRQLLATLVADLRDRVEHPDDEVRVATWSLDAGLDPDPVLLRRAAERAWWRGDHHLTRRLADAGWDAEPSAELGHLLGLALGRTGDCERADEVLDEAWRLATTPRTRLLIGHVRCDNLFRGLADRDGALAWSREVERGLDGAERREIVADRAMLLLQLGDVGGALELARPFVEDPDEPRPFVAASYATGLALVSAGRTDEAIAVAERALPIHERVWRDDLFSTEPGVHHVTRVLALIESGRLREAEPLTELGVQIAAQSGRWYGFGFFAMLRGLVLARRGRPRQSERWGREAASALLGSGYPSTARWALSLVALGRAQLGDVGTAADTLREVDELRDRTPVRRYEGLMDDARGWTLVAKGEPEAARRHFADAARRDAEGGSLVTAALLAHGLARVGGAAEALPLLERLSEQTHGEMVELRRDHAAALAADDPERLMVVGERLARLGADLEAADALAAAATSATRAGSRREATSAARSAMALSAACEGATTPALRAMQIVGVEPLTEREREVAVLAAAKLSSREIGRRLHISARTVDNHLQRVYRKLGVRGRDQLDDAIAQAPGSTP